MGSSSSTPAKRPVVVIIGAGAAGLALATKLDTSGFYETIVIDRRNYYFHPIGALRAAVQPSFVPQIALPFDNVLKNGIVVRGEVTRIDTEARVIEIHGRNSPLRFDHLVIATGSSYAFPRRVAAPDVTQAKAAFDTFYQQLVSAKNVLIIGGGTVGVELAGEIATDFPNKSVTIVQRGEHLVHPHINPKHEAIILKQLNKLNVRVFTKQSVDTADLEHAAGELLYVPGERRVATNTGTVLDTDLVVFANGPQINSSVYEQADSPLLASVRDHRLVVDEFFHVNGTQNVYAIGDCALIESRQAWFAGLQAAHLANNLIAIARNKAVKPYKAQPADKLAIFLSIGRKGGSGEMDGSVMGAFLVSAIKSGSLFVSKTHNLLKVKAPSKNSTDVLVSRGAAAVSKTQREFVRLSLDVSSDAVDELARGYPARPIQPDQLHA